MSAEATIVDEVGVNLCLAPQYDGAQSALGARLEDWISLRACSSTLVTLTQGLSMATGILKITTVMAIIQKFVCNHVMWQFGNEPYLPYIVIHWFPIHSPPSNYDVRWTMRPTGILVCVSRYDGYRYINQRCSIHEAPLCVNEHPVE
jgi:hypothetical protein